MLSPQANRHGFAMVPVVGALIIVGLLMMTASQLSQDHVRRAALSADYALALAEAEAALAAAECEIAIATSTPGRADCRAAPDYARTAALDPVTLAGFVPGECGEQGATRGLCWPPQNQSAAALADLAKSAAHAVPLDATETRGGRSTTPARYVIEPIPDALAGQWMHAGVPRAPSLFRITAIGFGPSSGAANGAKADALVNVMLQTVYRPRRIEP